MLPGWQGEKIMEKFKKRVRYDDTSTGKGNYNAIHDNSLYEVEYPNLITEKLEANIIA